MATPRGGAAAAASAASDDFVPFRLSSQHWTVFVAVSRLLDNAEKAKRDVEQVIQSARHVLTQFDPDYIASPVSSPTLGHVVSSSAEDDGPSRDNVPELPIEIEETPSESRPAKLRRLQCRLFVTPEQSSSSQSSFCDF